MAKRIEEVMSLPLQLQPYIVDFTGGIGAVPLRVEEQLESIRTFCAFAGIRALPEKRDSLMLLSSEEGDEAERPGLLGALGNGGPMVCVVSRWVLPTARTIVHRKSGARLEMPDDAAFLILDELPVLAPLAAIRGRAPRREQGDPARLRAAIEAVPWGGRRSA